jgi:hypothetical protein
MNPGYGGKVGKSVKDLGVGISAVGVRSPDRGDRVDRAVSVCGRVRALTLGPMAKTVIIKAAAKSVALYGVAVDPLTVSQIGKLRRAYSSAIWPRKCIASNGVGLLLVDRGRLDPQRGVVKGVVAAYVNKKKTNTIAGHALPGPNGRAVSSPQLTNLTDSKGIDSNSIQSNTLGSCLNNDSLGHRAQCESPNSPTNRHSPVNPVTSVRTPNTDSTDTDTKVLDRLTNLPLVARIQVYPAPQ